MKVGFVGLGKLGLPVATCMAARGIEVYGYDPNVGAYPDDLSYEDGFDILAKQGRVNFCDLDTVVATCDPIFVAVQTPHDPRYEGVTPLPAERVDFDYTYLRTAAAEIRCAAEERGVEPTVAVISTVLPGTMEREIIPVLAPLPLVYNPSFIAMGTTIRDFLNPEFVLLGGDNGEIREIHEACGVDRFYETTIANAELIKVAYNTFISLKLAFANTLLEVCHKTGCDVDAVTGALKRADRRLISGAYLDGGMGDGGSCFPPGELVMTEYGPRPIETIGPGDLVLAGDGELRPVVRRWEREYQGTLVKIKTEGMPPTLATPDHLFYVADDRRPPAAGRKHHPAYGSIAEHLGPLVEREAGDLEPGESFIAWTQAQQDFTQIVPDHATDEYLEMAGWYLAEGSIETRTTALGNLRSGRIRFDLHANEVTERNLLAELLPKIAPPKRTGRGAGARVSVAVADNRASVRYGSVDLARLLLADFGKGCADKTLPPWALWGPVEVGIRLLRGMICGDGHTSATGIAFSTTSPDLAYGAAILIGRLGIAPTLRCADRPNRLRQYEVRVRNGPDALALADHLGIDPPSSPGKGAERIADRGDGHFYRRLQSVERVAYEGPVYNLWVADVHSYVTSAGRVANCHPRDNIALSWLARELDLSYDIFEATMLQRERQAEWLAGLLEGFPDLPKGILGVSYKPSSRLTAGSHAILVRELLTRRGHEVAAYDPHVHPGGKIPPGPRVWLVGCRHPEFADLTLPAGSVVIDPWRYIFDQDGVEVIRLGGAGAPAAGKKGER